MHMSMCPCGHEHRSCQSLMCILGKIHVRRLFWFRALCSICPWPLQRRFNVPSLGIMVEKRADRIAILPLLSRWTFRHFLLHVCWGLQINRVVQLVVQYIKASKIRIVVWGNKLAHRLAPVVLLVVIVSTIQGRLEFNVHSWWFIGVASFAKAPAGGNVQTSGYRCDYMWATPA